jgi:hypothetical protein
MYRVGVLFMVLSMAFANPVPDRAGTCAEQKNIRHIIAEQGFC